MKSILYIISLLTFFTIINYSCKEEVESIKVEIKEGKHYSNIGVRHQKSNELNYMIIFSNNCVYDIDIDQTDKNKLFGLSPNLDVNWDNQSFRHSWYYNNDSIYLGAYVYDEKYGDKPLKIPIGTVCINEWVYLGIKDYKDSVQFTCKNEIFIIYLTHHDTTGYYIPSPYFGGNRTAPHDINFEIIEL